MAGGYPLGLDLCNATDIGTVLASTQGAAVSISLNAVGGWAQIVAATPHDSCYMIVCILPSEGSALMNAIDIGVGVSGSEKMVIQQLMVCSGTAGAGWTFGFPICIPAGTRISARGQGSAADTCHVSCIILDGAYSQIEGGAGVDCLGFVAASTLGTSMDPGGTINTKGAYAQLSASTARDYMGFVLDQTTLNQTQAAGQYLVDIAIGPSGSETIILPNYFLYTTGQEGQPSSVTPFIPILIPAGTRISARCSSSINTATTRIFGLTMYCLYQ